MRWSRLSLGAATAGLLAAWAGLLLPWRRWSSEAGADAAAGFAESRPFWIVLAAVTLLAPVALASRRRWPSAIVAAGALALVAIAAREIGAALADAGAFVAVGPGAGAVLSLIGAIVVLAAALTDLAPRAVWLTGALGAIALVVAAAVVWPRPDGRPAGGAIADVVDDGARALAIDDGTLYRLAGGFVTAEPAPGRSYEAVGVLDAGWTGEEPVSSGISPLGIAFAGEDLYVSLGGIDRLASIAPEGDRRLLVSRPPDRRRDEPQIPAGQNPQMVEDFTAGPIAAAPGGVYVLRGDRLDRWRAGRLETVARGFDGARDVATDARGRAYVADTGNGRVRRIDPDGTVRTVVGTAAPRRCVRRGLDDPLALDARRCTGVRALAVDAAENLYLAQRGVARIVSVTPEGRMAVVAGSGPKGWGDGHGRAARARLGAVEALTVGPEGDLYVAESWPVERVRRIADPAGVLEAPGRDVALSGCAEIAALTEGVLRAQQALLPPEIGAAVAALDRRVGALEAAAPDAIRDEVRKMAATFRERAGALAEASFVLADVGWSRRVDLYLGVLEIEPGPIGDYAEDRCGLIAGYDVGVDEINEFCVDYQRFVDRESLLPAPGEEPPRAYAAVVRAAPPVLAVSARAAWDGLVRMAGRSPPASEVELVGTRMEAVDTFASSACAID